MNRLAIALIRLYQASLGKLIGGQCRFYPTCSAYAIECFEHFGFFQAAGRSLWRILRCNPFSQGYFDPVLPEAEASGCNHSGRGGPMSHGK